MKLKIIFYVLSICHAQNRSRLELFTDSQNRPTFLDIFEENLRKLNTSYREIYFLGDFNINLFENGNMILINPPVITKTQIHSLKNYHEYCTLFVLKQLIICPTRVTCNSQSILDMLQIAFLVGFLKAIQLMQAYWIIS